MIHMKYQTNKPTEHGEVPRDDTVHKSASCCVPPQNDVST